MLETIRQYAREKLLEAGEGATVRARHLGFFVALAESSGEKLDHAENAQVYYVLENDHDNLRAAMDWALEGGEIDSGLRLMVGEGGSGRGRASGRRRRRRRQRRPQRRRSGSTILRKSANMRVKPSQSR